MSDTATAQPTPTPQSGPTAPVPTKAGNGLATAGFVLALIGLLGSFIPVLNVGGMALGILGAILAAAGLAKAKKSGTGKGLAVSGIVLGVLALIIGIIINVAFANAVDDAVDEATDTVVEAPADTTDNGATDDEATDDEATDDAATDDGAADSALGTTRDNPAPLGSAITGGDWTVTIDAVSTADQDSIGQTPAAGSTLLVIALTATYTGDDEQGSTPWASVSFVTAQGTTIDGLDGSTMFLPDGQFDSLATVFSGATVTGNKMIEVPADGWESGVLAVSPDLFSDSTFVAVR